MYANSKKALVALTALAMFATACTKHHNNNDDGAAPAKPVVSSAEADKEASKLLAENAANKSALSIEMKNFDPSFNVEDTILSDKIDGISIELKTTVGSTGPGTVETVGSVPNTQTFVQRLKGKIKFKGSETLLDLRSQAIPLSDATSGKPFDLEIIDGTGVSNPLGGEMVGRARCMDASCSSVSVWLHYYQAAGYIFTKKDKAFQLSIAQSANTISVEDASVRAARNTRGDN